jgi:hypothetical protein
MNFLNASRNPERGNPAEPLQSGRSEPVQHLGSSSPSSGRSLPASQVNSQGKWIG